MLSRSILAATGVLCAANAGCLHDDDSPACGPLRAACDIRTLACQQEVFHASACERDQASARMPKVRVISRKQLASELNAEALGYQPSVREQAWERANQLLGFLPPDKGSDESSVELIVAGVAAYYSRASKSITVIEDSAEAEEEGSFTLSHEFVHALQDQRDGFAKLDRLYADSSDAALALDALTEGEATLLSNFVMLRADGVPDLSALRFDDYFAEMLDAFLDDIGNSSAPLLAALQTLSYPVGGAGLSPLYRREELAGIESLYEAPYTTLASWIDAPRVPAPLDCRLPRSPEGHVPVVQDRLGAAGLLALDVVAGLGTDLFKSAPERWRNDLITVYTTPEAETPAHVAVHYRVLLASSEDAAELCAALQARTSDTLQVQCQGAQLELIAAESTEALAAWDFASCDEDATAKSRRTERAPESLRERLGIAP